MAEKKRSSSDAAGERRPRALTPAGYSKFVRQKVALRLEQVCDALLDKAAKGDVAAVKALLQMADLDKGAHKETGPVAPLTKQVAYVRKTLAEYRAGRST